MSTLAKTVCTLHLDRSATARCPKCRRFYCAECVTEHAGKLVCASCLAAESAPLRESQRRERTRFSLHPAAWLQWVAAWAILWVIFYFFARFLGDIPDAFHDGTIWE